MSSWVTFHNEEQICSFCEAGCVCIAMFSDWTWQRRKITKDRVAKDSCLTSEHFVWTKRFRSSLVDEVQKRKKKKKKLQPAEARAMPGMTAQSQIS